MTPWLFHLAFVALYVTFFGIRSYYLRRAQQSRGEVSYIEGRTHRTLRLIVGIPYMLALAGYMVWPSLLGWAAFPLPDWARWTGLLLGLACVALIVWIQRALGANFDVTLHVRTEHTLVTAGPYRWVRHPMYTVLLLFELAMLLLTANWFVNGIPLIALIIIIATRVRREEAVMLNTFGEAYRRYMERTGRFLPRLIYADTHTETEHSYE